ncbi:hypothetical protein EG850_07050 [Gulosibacter macacae]|uniref:Hemagglutinin n=1 Tax=Gulosibacter macacae TaxID=2488791 RepID=A0A3P3VVF1_9MICO|nr:hypothetical protein [Gulosibacter macacae]RRJ86771.1 hypothetical protein EG850_07050 [Gulosibacter macacae]
MTRVKRVLAWLGIAALLATFLVVAQSADDRAPEASAADASQFNPGMIIADALFYDSMSMSAAEVQAFLNDKGRYCTSNCLKDFRQTTISQPATSRCNAYTGRAGETAAQIIVNVAVACGISPKALLVLLEKETSLVSMNGPGDWRYERAMGYYCPDDPSRPGWCHPDYGGFFNQVYNASAQLKRYAQNPNDYGYRAGRTNYIQYNPNASCGGQNVYIENQATASLYIYTPYVPNRAALNNLYGTGDGCSAYGNRNFWRMYTDWFGSTTSGGTVSTKSNPYGGLDVVAGGVNEIELSGWAVDPDNVKQSLYVWVTIDGKGQHIYANKPRPDVAAALPGFSGNLGYSERLPATSGNHEVCVTYSNIGAGQHTSKGCKTVSVTGVSPADPIGSFDVASAIPGGVNVSGWAFEPDNLSTPVYVWVTANGKGQFLRANKSRPDVTASYPEAGSNTGFEGTLSLPVGTHAVCVTLNNTGGGSRKPLGCKSVTVTTLTNTPPKGNLESVVGVAGAVKVDGWAFDVDSPSSNQVRIEVGGNSTIIRTGIARTDVARVINSQAGYSGFSTSIAAAQGSQRVCAWAVDVGGTQDLFLGCQTVTVLGSNPMGSIDKISLVSGGLLVTGWAADADRPTSPVTLRFTVDGNIYNYVANGPRSDVKRYYPALSNNTGYAVQLGLKPGWHAVCIDALNQGAGKDTRFGCFTIQTR